MLVLLLLYPQGQVRYLKQAAVTGIFSVDNRLEEDSKYAQLPARFPPLAVRTSAHPLRLLGLYVEQVSVFLCLSVSFCVQSIVSKN